MTISLLKTKLYIPPARPAAQQIARPRLIEELNAGASRQLTLISASAGFGKTTLLGEWIHQGERSAQSDVESPDPSNVAWLSLDQGDNDLTRFLSYIVAALQTVHPDLGKGVATLLQSPQAPPVPALLATIINEITTLSARLFLVLDDYHVLDAQPVHDVLVFLLDNLPPQLHVVIASRVDPPLPLARMRVRQMILELRDADLRFTPDEASAFLNQAMTLDLTRDQVAALDARIEGWIAGLQLAALSLQRHANPSQFIRAFAGDNRYVMDYLLDEVLSRQSEEIQTFLLQTSILDRFCGSLCNVVIGGDGPSAYGQEMLEELERTHLFVIPLDDRREWYRYHHLFADLLRYRLRRTYPHLVSDLYCRASEWFEAHDLIVAAVENAMLAGDTERGARLVEEHAFSIMDHGELTTVVKWLDALPEDAVRSRPWLSISCAWALMYTGQMEAVEPRLQDAEKSSAGQDRNLQGYNAAMRAYVAGSRGQISRLIEYASQALELLSDRESVVRSFASAILSSGYRFGGDLEKAGEIIAQAIAISESAGDCHMTILASCNLAAIWILQGKLDQAAEMFRGALKLADQFAGDRGRRPPFAGLASTGLATVLRQWNDLGAAVRSAKEGIKLSSQWGQAEVTMHGYVELAHVLQAQGDDGGVLGALEKAAEVAKDLAVWTIIPLELIEARLRLAQGHPEAAYRWVQKSSPSAQDRPDFQHVGHFLMHARVLIAQHKLEEASAVLAQLFKVAEDSGACMYEIEILVLQAVAFQARGNREMAVKSLTRALSLAAPRGFVRIFLDEGAPMARLLRQEAVRVAAPDHVDRLLASFRGVVSQGRPSDQPLVDPLSERELEVLRLVTAGMSNRQIAAELYLAVGTIKKHISNIYSKLYVNKRTLAVARARELDLL